VEGSGAAMRSSHDAVYKVGFLIPRDELVLSGLLQ
jgi:hypothetical protein